MNNLNSIDVRIDGGYQIDLPKMVKVQQHFTRQTLKDIPLVVKQEMSHKLNAKIFLGKRIAVAVGSRGIQNIALIVKSTVEQLLKWGAFPFIVPAMGSHGGATPEGQINVLADYGIDEQSMGCPIVSSMEVIQLTSIENDIPIYFDKHAFEADGIVVVNRVKPHTDFKGNIESGLLKMLAIGLGKHKGATTLHSNGFDQFHRLIPKAGKAILEKAPISFGLAILENAYDETARIVVLPRENIYEEEKVLLIEAKNNMPKLLMSEIDVLIVEQLGKDISGSGMDPNITGRTGTHLPGFEAPTIQKIVVLDLTKKTNGNAIGIGVADVTTTSCVSKINFNYMYANSITSTVLEGARIPLMMNSDKEAIVIALKTCNRISQEHAKVVRIKNTLVLDQIEVSTAYLEELGNRKDISILSEETTLVFSEEGKLV